jgi:molecular chaperone HtpG
MKIGQGWSPKDWPGIYITTRGMPTGISIQHPSTYNSGYWRRVFMVLQDNEMNFDVGRKYLQGRAAPMMKRTAKEVWDDINSYLKNLTPADSKATKRRKQGKMIQLMQEAQDWNDLGLAAINYEKVPQREQMVVALFYELSGANIIRGYRTLRNNDIDQYDAFIHYRVRKSKIGSNEAVDIDGNVVEDWIMLEFKHDADSILDDILSDKKHYQDINLLVCWSLDKNKFESENIDVERIPEENIYYYGSTHRLYFPGIYKAGETLDVIELSTFIE